MNTKLKSICVYCGSSPGASSEYLKAARSLGAEIAGRGMRLVYGGASVGLMGAVAKAALAEGGHVTGVIPQALADQDINLMMNLLKVNIKGEYWL